MPVHDWTRVPYGTFHDFHNGWIIHLKETLNRGLLPRGYYALSEQHAGRGTPWALTVRHVSGDRIIALVEIVSPSNKDRPVHVAELTDKAETALRRGIHVLLVDLFAPGPHDPQGMHGAIWARFYDEPIYAPPPHPLTLGSCVARPRPDVYLEHLAVGAPLIDMPLFLSPDRYINVPLEPTYLAAYADMPERWRGVLEATEPGASA
jgi:hypothetical protein